LPQSATFVGNTKTTAWNVGDRVEAVWKVSPPDTKHWFPGRIQAVKQATGLVDVMFDDHHFRTDVPPDHVQALRSDNNNASARATLNLVPRLSPAVVAQQLFQSASTYLKLHVDQVFCAIGLQDIIHATQHDHPPAEAAADTPKTSRKRALDPQPKTKTPKQPKRKRTT
jgi:hypothetical protein